MTEPSHRATLPPPRPDSAGAAARERLIRAKEPRNLLALVFYQISLRIAWIFKTETVIMPAFLDTIAGQGWLRGFLPFLNRFGQSLPPILYADRLRRSRRKKWALMVTALCMAIPFLGLSALWFLVEEKRQPWLPSVFLLAYLAFFAFTGLNLLSFGTIQGKLIQPARRGRLLGLGGVVGSTAAILCAWILLQAWLGLPDGGFGYIFAFTGLGFMVASLFCLTIAEPADAQGDEGQAAEGFVHAAWRVVRRDGNFRRTALVAMLFISSILLFPHYQALARERLGLGSASLMVWVVAQNAGAGLFSLLAGIVADRFGNRLTLRLGIVTLALTPLLALRLAASDVPRELFWLTFFFLGMTPVTIKTLMNYTLEISAESDHPRYLSTMSLCLALPFCLSPLFGLLVDLAGFETVFVIVSGLVLLGGLLTFRMWEPRRGVET